MGQVAVGAVVRRGKEVLLVSEETGDGTVWALPGGAVGAGDDLLAGVAAETGFQAVVAERLLWVARYTVSGQDFEMLGFEVTGVGDRRAAGEWVPLAEAVERLGRMWFAPIREPAVAYLTGRARVATVWTWVDLERDPVTVPGVRSV